MYSDFTLLFQQAGPFSERFPVSTMIALQHKKMLTMVTDGGSSTKRQQAAAPGGQHLIHLSSTSA